MRSVYCPKPIYKGVGEALEGGNKGNVTVNGLRIKRKTQNKKLKSLPKNSQVDFDEIHQTKGVHIEKKKRKKERPAHCV